MTPSTTDTDRERESRTIGVMGGSFDPPHMGHIMLIACGLAGLGLEEVWVVPCRAHPYGKPLSTFEDRVAMCRLAVASLGRRVRVDPIEGELGPADQPSYTVDTVEALRERHPGVRLRLLLGSDLAVDFDEWHESERLRRLAPPLIVPRMAYHDVADEDGEEVRPLSSTAVRGRVCEGRPLEGCVPQAVEQFIRQRGLYRDRARV